MDNSSANVVTVVQQMIQMDANLAGNVHGGTIMKLIDNTAGIAAVRHAKANVVTASIDQLDFHSPVFVGELLRVSATVNYVGNTSMEVGVRVEAENFVTGEIRHTASAYLTFVSLDEHGKPKTLPPLNITNPEQKRRNEEAQERRNLRKLGIEIQKYKRLVAGNKG